MINKLSQTSASEKFDFIRFYSSNLRTTINSGFFTEEDSKKIFEEKSHLILSANGFHSRKDVEEFLKDWNKEDQLNWFEQ
ncbi:MAG TPA: hypothetical protein DC057_14375 [Spirochaetia bacterium]|nr:hypothetical protein [Spirochaetia bacterium]